MIPMSTTTTLAPCETRVWRLQGSTSSSGQLGLRGHAVGWHQGGVATELVLRDCDSWTWTVASWRRHQADPRFRASACCDLLLPVDMKHRGWPLSCRARGYLLAPSRPDSSGPTSRASRMRRAERERRWALEAPSGRQPQGRVSRDARGMRERKELAQSRPSRRSRSFAVGSMRGRSRRGAEAIVPARGVCTSRARVDDLARGLRASRSQDLAAGSST